MKELVRNNCAQLWRKPTPLKTHALSAVRRVLSGEVESPTLMHRAFGCEFQPTYFGEVKRNEIRLCPFLDDTDKPVKPRGL
jgi:hypothetical protein